MEKKVSEVSSGSKVSKECGVTPASPFIIRVIGGPLFLIPSLRAFICPKGAFGFNFYVDKPGDFRYYYMQKKMKKSLTGLMVLLLFLLLTLNTISHAQTGFAQKDRELLIQLQTTIKEIDKRFEQIDKRFSEMRDDMNKRFSEMREDMNKRFEQVDKRFGEMMTYIGILAAIFAAITVGAISFALWDRKTMIRPFETKVAELDKKNRGKPGKV